jgi:hypothetical protein
LLGEDEGDVELESVPDSDDIREEVEMEKMIEEGGIEDNGVGSVDETTKVGSEKRDGINIVRKILKMLLNILKKQIFIYVNVVMRLVICVKIKYIQ